MDPLSRKLNSHFDKLLIQTPWGNHCTNHLLFIDDLKILAKTDEVLADMMKETKKFFEVVGLEMNVRN